MITLFKDPIFNTFDKVFDDFYLIKNQSSYINSNIKNEEDGYTLHLAVPGLSKEDLKLTLKDRLLIVSYEKPENSNFSFVSSFRKTYSVPDNVIEKDIKAKVENGVLEINIPKNKKKAIERLISLN
jgi:HSP20 family protein